MNNEQSMCPTDEEISELLLGKLPRDKSDQLFVHVEFCSKCQDRTAAAEAVLGDDVTQAVAAAPPTPQPASQPTASMPFQPFRKPEMKPFAEDTYAQHAPTESNHHVQQTLAASIRILAASIIVAAGGLTFGISCTSARGSGSDGTVVGMGLVVAGALMLVFDLLPGLQEWQRRIRRIEPDHRPNR